MLIIVPDYQRSTSTWPYLEVNQTNQAAIPKCKICKEIQLPSKIVCEAVNFQMRKSVGHKCTGEYATN